MGYRCRAHRARDAFVDARRTYRSDVQLQPEIDGAILEAGFHRGLLLSSQRVGRSRKTVALSDEHSATEVGANLEHELPSTQLLRRAGDGG